MTGVRVEGSAGTALRRGARANTRYRFAPGLDRPAAWIAVAAPIVATIVVMIVR